MASVKARLHPLILHLPAIIATKIIANQPCQVVVAVAAMPIGEDDHPAPTEVEIIATIAGNPRPPRLRTTTTPLTTENAPTRSLAIMTRTHRRAIPPPHATTTPARVRRAPIARLTILGLQTVAILTLVVETRILVAATLLLPTETRVVVETTTEAMIEMDPRIAALLSAPLTALMIALLVVDQDIESIEKAFLSPYVDSPLVTCTMPE